MHMSKARAHLLATTIIVSSFAAMPAYAQTQTTASLTAPAPSEIIVTGSHLASPTLTSGAPLQVIDSKAIESTGASILQDVLLQNPVVSSPTLSRTNSNFLTSSGGVATVNLRNLGDDRTLVLVDGHRFVSGVPNSPAVDINSIPTAFIDRVEIVSGGESSIYGSDAVAGVVNLIYKKHFEGVQGNVQAGVSQKGDDTSKQANLLFGSNFSDDRGNVMVYAGYSKDGPVYARDRKRSAIDQSSLGAENGNIDDVFVIDRPVRSSYLPEGTFFSDNGEAVTGNGFDASNGVPQSMKFNRQSYRYIATPVERYLVATRANYEISPAANVFLDATFAHSHTKTDIEPNPLDTFTATGLFRNSTGEFSLGTRNPDGTIFINPLIPAFIRNIAVDDDGDGIPDLAFSRRMTDIGDRGATADRFTYEITTGVEGEISDKWHYDVFGSYGRTQDDQISTGGTNAANFRNALSVIQAAPNAPGAIQAPDGTWVQCADPNARGEGCVPANIFGANTLSPAAAKYISAPSTSNAFAEQIDIGANVTGQLFDLWGAGPVRVASGVEYRKETSAQIFDALTNLGENGGNALPNTSGSFDVVEGYGEIHIPILTDKPFFKALEARAAGRVSHYSTVGTVYSYSYGGVYSPTKDITFRASVALATRAPNIGELFSGLSQTFPTGLIDPCEHIGPTGGGVTGDNCRANPGVAANIAQNGTFTLTQNDRQGISGFNGGNPNLKEEKGHTVTAGVVINPRSIEALRNFSLTVDYTRTHVTGAVVQTDRQTELNQCYEESNQAFCGLIIRRPSAQGNASAGALQFVNSFAVNSGGILTSAIDMTASYRQGLGSFGSLSGTLSYTHLLQGWTKAFTGAPKDYFAGEIGTPKDKFLATLNWSLGPVNLEYRGQFLGRSYLDDQFVLSLTNADGSPVTDRHDKRARIGAYYIQDLQVNFDAGDHLNFYVGVNNLLDIAPPPVYSNLPGDVTGSETDASDYDAIGRRFYAGARLRF